MAVDSVNGNNNTALYTGIGAVAGAGAGVAAGYLTKPFLKDGAPTDEFVKKVKPVVAMSDSGLYRTEQRNFIGTIESKEDLKNSMLNKYMENFNVELFERIQSSVYAKDTDKYRGLLDMLFKGFELEDEDIEKIKKMKTGDDVKLLLKEWIDETIPEESLEDLKNGLLVRVNNEEKDEVKGLIESVWDTKEKKFVNCEDCVGKFIKDTARSIQGKYALIYGSIGAAVLGLGTYLFAHGKSSKADAVESQSAK